MSLPRCSHWLRPGVWLEARLKAASPPIIIGANTQSARGVRRQGDCTIRVDGVQFCWHTFPLVVTLQCLKFYLCAVYGLSYAWWCLAMAVGLEQLQGAMHVHASGAHHAKASFCIRSSGAAKKRHHCLGSQSEELRWVEQIACQGPA